MWYVTAVIQFTAKPGHRDTLVGGLSQAINATISNPHCFKADLLVDQDSDTKFSMIQHWRTSDAHREYVAELMKSEKMQQMLGLMEHPPQTTYYDTKASGGGEWGGPGHLELSTNDMDATKAFLSSAFGWRFEEWMPGYTGWWAPGALMGGLRPTMEEEPTPQAVPYLVVDDLDARLVRVKEAGGTITVPIQEIPHAGRFFWFLTPGGLQLAVWESAPQG